MFKVKSFLLRNSVLVLREKEIIDCPFPKQFLPVHNPAQFLSLCLCLSTVVVVVSMCYSHRTLDHTYFSLLEYSFLSDDLSWLYNLPLGLPSGKNPRLWGQSWVSVSVLSLY